jgi:hypothetical protein
LLLLVYCGIWGFISATAFIAIQQSPTTSSNPGVVGIFFVAAALGAAMCPLLLVEAVLIWRANVVGVVLTLLTSVCVALPLLLMLGAELLYTWTHPALFDWKFTLGDIAVLILGPGLVIALLLVPGSYRAWRLGPPAATAPVS